ncbi:MAG: 30S ribosomal protein S1 [Chloroflexi bacterium]|nr:MAG: 30S ribosomal protein S1 [Chloroflexota bacterium]
MPAEQIGYIDESGDEFAADQEANPMAEMLDQYLSCRNLVHGQIVSGTVVHIRPGAIIVDIGAKCEGIVPESDLEELSQTELDAIHVDDKVLAYVVNPEDDNDNIILSLSRAQIARDWLEAQQLFESQAVIKAPVIDHNKGGVIVQVGKVRGFAPVSQISRQRATNQQFPKQEGDERWWSALVGESLQLKVVEVDRERNRLILSERAAMSKRRKDMLDELTVGEVRQGQVTNLTDFGAFVDIGGIDGLVHVSELSWKRVEHPREVVKAGQEVNVQVMRVDQKRERVALSIKQLQPDPWASIEERYQEGQAVEAIITRLAEWGAFASIVGDEAIEGLIHISELDDSPVVHPREVVQVGQTVTLRVIGVDGSHHRMALSLKQATQGEFMGRDWKAALKAEQPEPEGPLSAALSEAMDSS